MKWSEWFAAMESSDMGPGALCTLRTPNGSTVAVVWPTHYAAFCEEAVVLYREGSCVPLRVCSTPADMRRALDAAAYVPEQDGVG